MEIKKTFRLNLDEEHQLMQEMETLGETNFSQFVRNKLLYRDGQSLTKIDDERLLYLAKEVAIVTQKKYQERTLITQLEKIFLTLYQIQVLSEVSNQVAHEHMKKVMACFRTLLTEVDKEGMLSEEFKEEWL